MKNIPLMILDLLLLPLTLLRLFFIYLYGSRYGVEGLRSIDVMMHAKNKHFNHNEESTVDVEEEDIRIVIRDDTRIYPQDIKMFLEESKEDKDKVVKMLKPTISDNKPAEEEDKKEVKDQNESERELDDVLSEFNPGVTHFGKFNSLHEVNVINTNEALATTELDTELGRTSVESDDAESDSDDYSTTDESDEESDNESALSDTEGGDSDNEESELPTETDPLVDTASYSTKDALNKAVENFMEDLDK